MATFNTPNHSFVVVVSDDNGRQIEAYQIDQSVDMRQRNIAIQRARNLVEAQLHRNWQRTGFTYAVVYEGNPEMAKAILQAETACPF